MATFKLEQGHLAERMSIRSPCYPLCCKMVLQISTGTAWGLPLGLLHACVVILAQTV